MGNSCSLPRCVHAPFDRPQPGATGGEGRANDSEHPTPQRRASGGPGEDDMPPQRHSPRTGAASPGDALEGGGPHGRRETTQSALVERGAPRPKSPQGDVGRAPPGGRSGGPSPRVPVRP